MPGTTKDLHGVLDDYRKFLREKNLAPPAHQPYLVRWVRAFLLFARAHAGYSFEQTLDLFLAECCGSVTVRGPAQLTPKPECGATGARILVTLLYALKHRGLKKGIASLCLGGG
ncbi:MAG: hypothetical protein R6U98_07985, partial [Pirellulaceae bacterium]